MFKSKKIIIIISIVIFALILLAFAVLVFLPKIKSGNEKNNKEQANENTTINLENEFASYFANINYQEQSQEIISTIYELNKSEEGKYEVDVHFPKINLDSAKEINDEIINVFGAKLLDVVQKQKEFTTYNVNYVFFVNNGIVSVVIKCTLKEGDLPQRIMIKTYNYDLVSEKIVSLKDLLEGKNIELEKAQQEIYSTIKANNQNTETLANQGYNVYVRNLESEEYKIDNIDNYFLDKNGELIIIFPYGNKNFTGTMDLIKLNK